MEDEEIEEQQQQSQFDKFPPQQQTPTQQVAATKPPVPSAKGTLWARGALKPEDRMKPRASKSLVCLVLAVTLGSRQNRDDYTSFTKEALREEVRHLIYFSTGLYSVERPSAVIITLSVT